MFAEIDDGHQHKPRKHRPTHGLVAAGDTSNEVANNGHHTIEQTPKQESQYRSTETFCHNIN